MEGRRRLPGACLSLSGNQISGIPRHQRDVVPVTASITHCLMSTQVRVVRKTLFAPREGRQFLLPDRDAGNYWLFDDVYEGSFNAWRPRRDARRQDGVHLFRVDTRRFCHRVQYAELPRRDVVEPVWKFLGRAGSVDRHAIEQASHRWRGGRREDSARTRRKILISTQVGAVRHQ